MRNAFVLALALTFACKTETPPEPTKPAVGPDKPAATAPATAAATTTATALATTAPAASTAPAAASTYDNPGMLDPTKAAEKAPEKFKAKFTTSKGDFTIEVTRAWSPNGADRFYNLVKIGFFKDVRFFRAIEDFMVQFGINGDPNVMAKWRSSNIQDDAKTDSTQSNKRGMVTFAKSGMPNSRSTQVFISYKDNDRLDASGFTPFGKVTDGMNVVDSFYKGYGEGAPQGNGPEQGRVQMEGNAYLNKDFPKLDWIKEAKIL
jgi:peptidyl-prolyl cis-trans isomerase A (cyclophilin A)